MFDHDTRSLKQHSNTLEMKIVQCQSDQLRGLSRRGSLGENVPDLLAYILGALCFDRRDGIFFEQLLTLFLPLALLSFWLWSC